ncbi:MAG: hypothetical protein KKA73_13370 [Chloroflexi bacterium]|nr:hypothetical protein [Chloroflexota bacterium]MBU1748672.1 hypothetical protein [Chloroflexota bacterium]
MTLVYLAAAFVTGIWLGSVLAVPGEILLLALAVPAVAALLWRRDARVRLGAICALFLLLAACRRGHFPPPARCATIYGYREQPTHW